MVPFTLEVKVFRGNASSIAAYLNSPTSHHMIDVNKYLHKLGTFFESRGGGCGVWPQGEWGRSGAAAGRGAAPALRPKNVTNVWKYLFKSIYIYIYCVGVVPKIWR